MTYEPKHRKMTPEDIDRIPIDPDWKIMRRMRDMILDTVDDDIQELCMELISEAPGFSPGMIDNDEFMDGPMVRLEDRIWSVLTKSFGGEG